MFEQDENASNAASSEDYWNRRSHTRHSAAPIYVCLNNGVTQALHILTLSIPRPRFFQGREGAAGDRGFVLFHAVSSSDRRAGPGDPPRPKFADAMSAATASRSP
jgi:hypothetical protein